MLVTSEGSVRVDLVGGTLDLEPINLILPNVVTLNVATSLKAKVIIEQVESKGIEIISSDYDKTYFYEKSEMTDKNLYYSQYFEEMSFVMQIISLFSISSGLKVILSSGAPAGSGLNFVDLSGEKPAGIPETSLNIGANFFYPVGGSAKGYLRGDWQYESEVQSNEAIFATTGVQQPFRTVSTFNAATGVKFDNGFAVQVWGRNIFNDEYVSTVFPGVLQTGVINGYINAPRTYGVNLRKDF